MARSIALSLLWVVASVSAAEWPCSVHPPKDSLDSALPELAKVAQVDAEKAALAGFANFAASVTVTESELEVEHGCLVYSFDIRVAGQPGVEEVLVDAGTAKILSRAHETSAHEAVEKRQEAAERQKPAH